VPDRRYGMTVTISSVLNILVVLDDITQILLAINYKITGIPYYNKRDDSFIGKCHIYDNRLTYYVTNV
jgi:hypothetical protein